MSYIAYQSLSYLVQANEAGTEVTNLHSGHTEWFQGDDSSLLREEIEGAARRGGVPSEVTERTDRVLSEYFGADR